MGCRPFIFPLLSWTLFYSILLEKTFLILCNRRQDEFNSIEQGNYSVTTYDARFLLHSRYQLQLLHIKKERIHWFVKGLNMRLQLLALQMVSLGKTFQEVVEYIQNVKGVKQDTYTKSAENPHKDVSCNGFFSKGQVSQGYSRFPCQLSMQV